jgi:hypothetical protein
MSGRSRAYFSCSGLSRAACSGGREIVDGREECTDRWASAKNEIPIFYAQTEPNMFASKDSLPKIKQIGKKILKDRM